MSPPGTSWPALARTLLGEATARAVVEPAVADMQLDRAALLGAALTAFLVSDPLLSLVTHRGVGLLAFGGSSTLAVFVALGMLIGAEARGRLDRAGTPPHIEANLTPQP